MLAAALTALSATARGQQALEFDPAFLELGGGQGGADLSVYATSNRVLPGVYPISVFVNGEAIERRDITFVSESARDGREDAIPCLSARMFDEWGVDIAAFAKLAQAGDLPDFFGPFQSWRTASVASVEQYRCLNSSGVR
ncbi:outer membrane usher protein [Burkholderia pseudomallei]|nr:hypothetical protein DP47_2636 [Burkholderia pseudomallei Pasteur 52237]CAJ6613917.1 outer membrane usher protein [Burkholderia pseudomallei]CAJ8782429.1 outer membrane usher protein [Burkholderia pseudomallei]